MESMKKLIITNNDKVRDQYGDSFSLVFVDGGYKDVLLKVRDLVHKGCILATHPLSGSVKPGETPYKSIIIFERKGPVDMYSLSLIEDSIATAEKFMRESPLKKGYTYTDDILKDFQEIDYTLLSSAVE